LILLISQHSALFKAKNAKEVFAEILYFFDNFCFLREESKQNGTHASYFSLLFSKTFCIFTRSNCFTKLYALIRQNIVKRSNVTKQEALHLLFGNPSDSLARKF